jgi:hypothetical protein
MTRSKPTIGIGVRVKMSSLGATRCPRLAGREGVVVGGGQYQSAIRIIFDGSKSPTSLHEDYIEPVDAQR